MDEPDYVNSEKWFHYGLRVLSDGRNEEAVDAFSEVIGFKPDHAQAFGFRGCAFYNLGDDTAALNDYEIALLLDPSLNRIRFFRAILYQNLDRYAEAVEDYTKAIEENRSWAEAYYFRGINRGLLNDHRGALCDLVFAARLGHEPAQTYLTGKGIVWQNLSQ